MRSTSQTAGDHAKFISPKTQEIFTITPMLSSDIEEVGQLSAYNFVRYDPITNVLRNTAPSLEERGMTALTSLIQPLDLSFCVRDDQNEIAGFIVAEPYGKAVTDEEAIPKAVAYILDHLSSQLYPPPDDKTVDLTLLCTSDKHQRKGLAAGLTKHFLSRMEAKGYDRVIIKCTSASMDILSSLGAAERGAFLFADYQTEKGERIFENIKPFSSHFPTPGARLMVYDLKEREDSDALIAEGITQKLDYIKTLGVDCIWLSPVYPSPNEDNGYDITDYVGIMPEFGTMEDWEEFEREAHSRDLKVIEVHLPVIINVKQIVMDLVVNHTSEQHPWFQEAKKSKDSPYRDYYIWRDGKNGKEPTNWISFFSGSVWKKNEATDDYYLHLFAKGQPDLNWESEKVREEVKNVIHFWAKRKVDGFRLDVINFISKVDGYPDATIRNCTEISTRSLTPVSKRDAFSKYDIFTVGETPFVTPSHGLQYTHQRNSVVDMLFQFELMDIDGVPGLRFVPRPWELKDIKRITNKWQEGLEGGGWNSNYLENHDQPRSVSRFGSENDPHLRNISAKALATWYIFLKGTPYVYQGQEIGMTNKTHRLIYRLDQYVDIKSVNWLATQKNKNKSEKELLDILYLRSRDNARTPMQWDDTPNAGFCKEGAQPWVGVNPNYNEINVEAAMRDPDSIFYFYQTLLRLRKQHQSALYGTYVPLANQHEKIYAYLRVLPEEQLLVLVNFFPDDSSVNLNEEAEKLPGRRCKLVLSNYKDVDGELLLQEESIKLRPHECRIYTFA
ncbi:oligo-1,6-glucosidase [Planoprotostelium fungivorum]|uniref:Oligo-1,6-glucosidase n=1 Tax=Planoprotostelium fungivorum TaxID=1890364 RepID=A0A2P6NRY3_9EUKA|nr:oligo-1,6-glucosidase [Planoprotostelium fungivorum]